MFTDVSKLPKPGTRIIHIDLDPMTLGRTYQEDVSIVADAQVALGMLGEAAKQSKLVKKPARWRAWTKKIQADVEAWRANFQKLAKEQFVEGRLNPRYVLACLNDTIRGDDVIVADTGYMAAWIATMIDQKAPGRGTLRAAGSLGWAFPAGLGAKLAVGENRRVFCLTGDGGIGHHNSCMGTPARPKASPTRKAPGAPPSRSTPTPWATAGSRPPAGTRSARSSSWPRPAPPRCWGSSIA